MLFLSLSLFCGILLIYIFFNIGKVISKKGVVLLRGILLLTFLLIPVYYCNCYITEVKCIPWLFWFSNYAYFILFNLAAYLYILLFYYSSNLKYLDVKKSIILLIPYLIVIVLVLSTRKTHLIFYLGNNNEYVRGKLNLIHPIICAGSIAIASGMLLYKSFKEPLNKKKKIFRIEASYALFPIIGGILEYIFGSISYFLCFAIVLGPVINFLQLQNNKIIKDAMTDINEKNALLNRIKKKIPYNGKKKLFLFMLDVNDFKKINDTFGHVSGDKAIKDVANCLLTVTNNSRAFVSRFGGDEFSVLYELPSEKEANLFIEKINETLSEINENRDYTISISIGYVAYNESVKNVDDFITLADNALYKVKEGYHKNNN